MLNFFSFRNGFPPSNTEAGATLFELLVGLTMGLSVSVLSLPSLREHLVFEAFAKKCRSIERSLDLARLSSVLMDELVEVGVTENRLRAILPRGNRILFLEKLPKGQPLIASPVSGKIIYRPSLSATPSTLTVKGDSHTCEVKISLRGRSLTRVL